MHPAARGAAHIVGWITLPPLLAWLASVLGAGPIDLAMAIFWSQWIFPYDETMVTVASNYQPVWPTWLAVTIGVAVWGATAGLYGWATRGLSWKSQSVL